MDARALGIVWPVKPDTLVDVTWAIGSEGLSKPLGFHDAAAIRTDSLHELPAAAIFQQSEQQWHFWRLRDGK